MGWKPVKSWEVKHSHSWWKTHRRVKRMKHLPVVFFFLLFFVFVFDLLRLLHFLSWQLEAANGTSVVALEPW
jgi:hypothetical protein